MSARNRFTEKLLGWLEGREYYLLKYLRHDLHELAESSDLDVLLPDGDDYDFEEWLRQQGEVFTYRLRRRHHMTQAFVFFTDGSFLQVDLLYRLIRKNLIYLPNREVMANKQIVNGISTYSDLTMLEHVLLFNVLNGSGLPAKYLLWYKDLPAERQQFLLEYLNAKYGTTFTDFVEMAEYDASVHRRLLAYVRRLPENRLFARARHMLWYAWDTLRDLMHPRGRIITFSGVDGAGKSTILEAFADILRKRYRQKVVVLRHRPSLLPILSAWIYGKQKAEQLSVQRLPRQGQNKSKLLSLLRFAYYFADYLIGQFYVLLRYKLRGYIVLYDRYYFDFIVDARRTNLELDEWLPRWLYRFLFEPDLNVFLYADARLIRARKRELDAATIGELTRRYKRLFEDLSGRTDHAVYLPLENVEMERTLDTLVRAYIRIA